jgi:hypothetical protein
MTHLLIHIRLRGRDEELLLSRLMPLGLWLSDVWNTIRDAYWRRTWLLRLGRAQRESALELEWLSEIGGESSSQAVDLSCGLWHRPFVYALLQYSHLPYKVVSSFSMPFCVRRSDGDLRCIS